MSMRFKLPPGGDCPPIAAARRIWLTLEEFTVQLPALQQRGFPPPDPTTGNFDLDAIDAWRRLRHPQLFAVAGVPGARDMPRPNIAARIARL